ncbi:hypothetical protein EYF80_021049 [Liparis tanakae]|uniref:Uncharacterized protein n=1 Tax=Liparis tanakae TaxID=230148 RepID=A0A4Z2HSQ0_9TELE|nr:hypothetical protein EYF80_021049 [Liparis tanakae]
MDRKNVQEAMEAAAKEEERRAAYRGLEMGDAVPGWTSQREGQGAIAISSWLFPVKVTEPIKEAETVGVNRGFRLPLG